MENLKYLHLYSDTCWYESDSFKDTPNTIVLTEQDYKQLGITLEFRNGQLVTKVQRVNYYASTVY